MPYRDPSHVEAWVGEFLHALPGLAGRISVLPENFAEGSESSVVVVSLEGASTVTSLQPAIIDGRPVWQTVFEPRDLPIALDSAGITSLAHDLTDLATLCTWLQKRTEASL